MQKKLLSLALCSEYVEQLSEKHGLTDKAKQLLLGQIQVLKNKYGTEIPKGDFLDLIGQQLKLMQTGYIKKKVDVEEFFLSSEYMNLQGVIRPRILEMLIDIFERYPHKYEVVLGGSIRSGKTFGVCCAFCYHAYDLSCLHSPQIHYSMSPGSEMLFVFQSKKEDKAKRNFREFYNLIEGSKYFKEHFPKQGRSKNYIKFPHNILVTPIPSNTNAAISENIFCAMMDEANFMNVIKGSRHQGERDQYYDQATQLYKTVKERIETQFADPVKDEWPGKLYLVSSANHKGDFIDKKKEEAKTEDHIYVFDEPIWNVKVYDPPLSGKKFWVELPCESHSGRILDKKPNPYTDQHIEVPIEFKKSFEADLISSIQNKAGVAVERTSSFISSEAIHTAIQQHTENYNGQQIFSTQEVNINTVQKIDSILNLPFIEAIKHYFPHVHAHLDMSLSEDSAGFGLGATIGSKEIERLLDEEEEEEKTEIITAPIYGILGLLRINPPDKGNISIEAVQELIFRLKDLLPNLRSFTSDFAHSSSFQQNVKKKDISANYISVDKNSEPYIEFRTSANEGRVWVPDHEKYKEELKYLKLHADTGKVDHDVLHSKDLADVATSIVFKLSKLRKSYKISGPPYTLQEMKRLNKENDRNEEKRQSGVERPISGNRPWNWYNI